MNILIDTNVLARMAQPGHSMYQIALDAVERRRQRRESLFVATQSLFELYVAATRPVLQNGFGMTSAQAFAELDLVESLFTIMPESPDTYPQWRALLRRHQVMGKTGHDARLVALMFSRRLEAILTFNVSDFIRFTQIAVLDPATLSSTQN